MANKVFANKMEVSCKAAAGKSVAAFPDVCFTPPTAPPTPPGVPLPYPNNGMASDCTAGSKTVKISGKEVMLKDKSYFKQSTGDEAGSAPKKGILTSVNKGKVYFTAWSMNVKFEGENAVRHFDMTTHNHASAPGQTPPWPYADSMNIADDPCAKDKQKEEDACGGKSRDEQCSDKQCKKAQACKLVPKGKDKEMCCPDRNTGHHMIEDHWIMQDKDNLMPDFAGLAAKNGRKFVKPGGPYDGAPTMCVDGDRFTKRHGMAHGTSGVVEDSMIGQNFNYGQGKAIALVAHSDAFPDSNCEWGCLEAQMDNFYGDDNSKQLRSPSRAQSLSEPQRRAAKKRFNIT